MRPNQLLIAVAFFIASGAAWAKLPAAPAADPMKAEEAKKKAAETAKIEAELLAKYQDRAVAHYKKTQGKPAPKATAKK